MGIECKLLSIRAPSVDVYMGIVNDGKVSAKKWTFFIILCVIILPICSMLLFC